MNDSRKSLPVTVPLLAFVLAFTLCCAVMTGVLVKGMGFSTQAREYSDAVQLCRNAAEKFRAGETLPEGKVYFDDTYRENPQGEYSLTVTEAAQAAPAGEIREAVIQVSTAQGKLLYTLTVQRYDREVQP